jgi:hypothetical protein
MAGEGWGLARGDRAGGSWGVGARWEGLCRCEGPAAARRAFVGGFLDGRELGLGVQFGEMWGIGCTEGIKLMDYSAAFIPVTRADKDLFLLTTHMSRLMKLTN